MKGSVSPGSSSRSDTYLPSDVAGKILRYVSRIEKDPMTLFMVRRCLSIGVW
jgi:hypothetical protein